MFFVNYFFRVIDKLLCDGGLLWGGGVATVIQGDNAGPYQDIKFKKMDMGTSGSSYATYEFTVSFYIS